MVVGDPRILSLVGDDWCVLRLGCGILGGRTAIVEVGAWGYICSRIHCLSHH